VNRITINGQVFQTDGSSQIVVNNGTVTVGGKVVVSGLNGVVQVKWEGPLASLRSDASVTCGDVTGNVDARFRKMKPQRPLNTAELEVLGLEPSDQDVKVEGRWTQRTLNELLKHSEAKYREPNHD